jgi:hypothetical protein
MARIRRLISPPLSSGAETSEGYSLTDVTFEDQ